MAVSRQFDHAWGRLVEAIIDMDTPDQRESVKVLQEYVDALPAAIDEWERDLKEAEELMAINCAICGDQDGDMHNIPQRTRNHPFLPVRPRFWTYNDVITWIKENASEEKENYDENLNEWAEESAVWWLAVEQAEAYRDLNLRELAEVLRDGLQPITLDDVTDELQNPYHDRPFDIEDLDNQVEDRLRDHFRLTPRGK